MDSALRFVEKDDRPQNGSDVSLIHPEADATTRRKIDEIIRAAYKKFGRGKFIHQALALGLRKRRCTVK
jgi:hypothetical protein